MPRASAPPTPTRRSSRPMRRQDRRIRAADASSAIMPACRTATALLCANFRADRAREILTALLDPDFDGFPRARRRTLRRRCRHDGIFRRRSTSFMATLFPPQDLSDTFGEVVVACRSEAAAHRRDREIRACHFLLQWRARRGIPGRGPHPGALAQGRDLRSEARDVGATKSPTSWSRRSIAANSISIVVQLRQYRHGRAIPAISKPRSRRSRRSIDASAGSPMR